MVESFLNHFQLLSLGLVGLVVATIVLLLYRKLSTIDDQLAPDSENESRTMPMSERRRTRRIQAGAVLELKDPSGQRVTGTAMLHDMSAKGARFTSPVVLKLKQKFQARMRSPKDGGMLELKAQVIWVRPGSTNHLYGVQFLSN